MSNVVKHPDGTITCAECGHKISKETTTCPCCKTLIAGYIDEKEFKKQKKACKKRVRDFSWIPIFIIVFGSAFYVGYKYDVIEPVTEFVQEQVVDNWDGTGIKGFINNIKAKNNRRQEAINKGLSDYDYHMTQFYVASEEDPDVKEALISFLTDSSIGYESLYYDSGYYVINLKNMPVYFTEDEYSTAQNDLSTLYDTYVNENAFILFGRTLYIQGTHKTVEG